MNEKAKKYVDLFRRVKIAAAATVDAEGHPQARIINVMLAEDDGMYIVTSRGKPFYKQLVETGEIAPGSHVSRLPVPEIHREAAGRGQKAGWTRSLRRIPV